MANLSIIGRHALLFDDDAAANFVNSAAALVPWGADPSLLIDRHDVRHLLDRVPPRPKPGYVYKSEEEVAEELVVDRERFLDLPSENRSGPDGILSLSLPPSPSSMSLSLSLSFRRFYGVFA
jgi:Alternative splicing regulator